MWCGYTRWRYPKSRAPKSRSMLSASTMIARGERHGTYPDDPILGPSREELGIWIEANTSNVHILRGTFSFVRQDAAKISQRPCSISLDAARNAEPRFGASFCIKDLRRVIATSCQIFAIRGKSDTVNNAEHTTMQRQFGDSRYSGGGRLCHRLIVFQGVNQTHV